jgi:hypothetical protein
VPQNAGNMKCNTHKEEWTRTQMTMWITSLVCLLEHHVW